MARTTYQAMVAELAKGVEELFPWELLDEIRAGAEPVLLDVRCPHEYEAAHIAGSINVPRGILEIACDYGYEETLPALVEARDRRVIAICRSGNRSVLAAHTLKLMGYTNVASLRTGLRGWNDYEQPLENATGESLDLDTADGIFLSRVTPEQLGAEARHVA